MILELVPGLKRLGWLGPESHISTREFVEATTRKLGLHLVVAETAPPNDFATAFASITQGEVQAMLVGGTPYNFLNRQVIVDFAARSRLPTMYHTRQFADVGGLICYGADVRDCRVLGEIGQERVPGPRVHLPKVLGTTVPLIARADEIID